MQSSWNCQKTLSFLHIFYSDVEDFLYNHYYEYNYKCKNFAYGFWIDLCLSSPKNLMKLLILVFFHSGEFFQNISAFNSGRNWSKCFLMSHYLIGWIVAHKNVDFVWRIEVGIDLADAGRYLLYFNALDRDYILGVFQCMKLKKHIIMNYFFINYYIGLVIFWNILWIWEITILKEWLMEHSMSSS